MHEAELLFTDILKCSRSSLYLNKHLVLNKAQSKAISSVLKKRIYGYPLQYILGKTEFMGLEFKVTPAVLIPRPETEVLVEKIIEIVHSQQSIVHRILDMGTGSGCIAISLAKILAGIKVEAVDISEEALAVARENARLNGVEVNFTQSDLFSSPKLRTERYELIASNPPYVSHPQFSSLQPEIRYEPRRALDGGRDGLDFYRRILSASGGHLNKNGFLVMEIGFDQRQAIENIIRRSGRFTIKETVKDYSGIERIIVAQYTGSGAQQWTN